MIQDIILKWAIPFLCGLVASGIGAGIALSRKKIRAMQQGMVSLLRAEILRSYEKYTERGFCPLYAREALAREYKAYHDLGGNDVATDLYHQVCELPTEKKEEKK